MRNKVFSFTIVAISLAFSLVTARAEWPARVFAPYMYIGAGDNFKLTNCADACGLTYYTLAFIIARQDGNYRESGPLATNLVYHKEPSWDGRIPIEQDLFHDQIDAIRQRGGDVIMSFGGEGGKELANVIDDTNQLAAAYQKVVDQYHFTWLDFDVEGNNLNQGRLASERRNFALAHLQQKNPGLLISYTLPVDPDGLSGESLALLADAKAKGVQVHSVNLMVMYFGKKFIGKGKSEGELGIDSANQAHAQLQQIDPALQVGLCPCLGRNGSGAEIFGLDDARTLKAFADKTPWICSLHYWSINDDAAIPRRKRNAVISAGTNNLAVPKTPQPWDFARIFQSFTAR